MSPPGDDRSLLTQFRDPLDNERQFRSSLMSSARVRLVRTSGKRMLISAMLYGKLWIPNGIIGQQSGRGVRPF